MAMHYLIDSRRQFVSVKAEGGITRADVEAYLEAVIGAGALEYRKLFDWRAGVPEMDFPEVMSVVAGLEAFTTGGMAPSPWCCRSSRGKAKRSRESSVSCCQRAAPCAFFPA
ncbi:MAG: hypothetical protein K2X72_04445 [Reyranella sp.]|nr:hypothetical protein [Reyranella sp.]